MDSNYNTILESIPADRIFIDPNRHIFPNMEDHNVFFFGRQIRTIVTRDLAVLHWWLYDVRRLHVPRIYSLIVGLGIHWCPGPTDPKPAIIQLCVGRRCIIFQLLQAPEIPASLHNFLLDRNLTFVGIKIGLACEKLRMHWGLVVAKAVDLQQLTERMVGVRVSSIGTLAAMFLGCPPVTKPPWVSRSAWDQRVLSLEQVRYACADAYIAFELGVMFLNTGVWGMNGLILFSQ